MADLKKQVAKDLADSGLFEWSEPLKLPLSMRENITDCGRWPTADESEELLAAMELEVIRNWQGVYEIHSDQDGYLADLDYDVPRGQRTLANNAALVWLSKQLDWKTELKAAIERIGWS